MQVDLLALQWQGNPVVFSVRPAEKHPAELARKNLELVLKFMGEISEEIPDIGWWFPTFCIFHHIENNHPRCAMVF